MTVYRAKGIELRLGDWREVLQDVEPDAVITDPPYSERTHTGQRSMRAESREDTAKKGGIPAIHYASGGDVPVYDSAWWTVVFGDHQSWIRHEKTLLDAGLYVFQPVIWAKPDATPRLSGDGPQSAVEYICVSRLRRRVRRSGSRPGYYVHATASAREGPSFVGRKPLALMRTLIRDYSEPGDLVCDPYSGTATTLIAAAMEGRSAIGAEIDPETFERACARIDGMAITPPLLVEQAPPAHQLDLLGEGKA